MTRDAVYRLLAVLMLGAIGAHRYATVRTPPDVRRYHERVRLTAASLPRHVGPWVGEDVPLPAQALEVLQPNVIVSRKYVNVETGVSAGMLFVHCSDAHDMAGHFPLRCYPAAGWTLKESNERDWVAGGMLLKGMEYRFAKQSIGRAVGEAEIVVGNFLLRPGGHVLREMAEMNRSIVGAGGQSTGAGQVHVYFDRTVSREERDEAVEALLGGFRHVIDAVLANPT